MNNKMGDSTNKEEFSQLLINDIINAIDENLIERRRKYVSLAYANEILLLKGIFTKYDLQNKILKNILEKGLISNSHQTDEKPRQWRILLSEEGKLKYEEAKKLREKEITVTPPNFQIINCPNCNIFLTISNEIVNNRYISCGKCGSIFKNPLREKSNILNPNNPPSQSWYSQLDNEGKKAFKWTMFILSVALIIVIVNVLPESNTSRSVTGVYYTKSGYFAGINKEVFDMAMDCALQHDNNCINQLVISGQLVYLVDGQQVSLISQTLGTVQIRPKGGTRTLWTVREAIRN